MKVYLYDCISNSYVHAGMPHCHLYYMNTIFSIVKHMDKCKECGQPYLLHHYLTTDLNYVMLTSPWMMEKFSHCICSEVIWLLLKYCIHDVNLSYSQTFKPIRIFVSSVTALTV